MLVAPLTDCWLIGYEESGRISCVPECERAFTGGGTSAGDVNVQSTA